MGSGGSDCAKGVESGRWAAARGGVDFGRGGGRASTAVCWNWTLWRLWRWGWSGAEGRGGRWGRNGTTARRASTPDDGGRRGRESDPADAGGAEIIMV